LIKDYFTSWISWLQEHRPWKPIL